MASMGLKATIAWYDQNAAKYAQTIDDHVNLGQLEDFRQAVAINGAVLDAGCGGGRDSGFLHRAGFKVTGLDLSQGLLDQAQQHYPGPTYIQGSFLQLPLANDSFDGIWAHASLVHLETKADAVKAIAEFARVLKQGGILHLLVKAQTGDYDTAVVNDKLAQHDRFFRYYTQAELANYLDKSGFEITQCEQYREIDRNPKGRPEVAWIYILARKAGPA